MIRSQLIDDIATRTGPAQAHTLGVWDRERELRIDNKIWPHQGIGCPPRVVSLRLAEPLLH